MKATHTSSPFPSESFRLEFARSLLAWYAANKRDLPWRGKDAYAVWISEIMLQQTQVATATPYFNRFLERFPTVSALADAPLEDVLQHWAGLGYYARARNLHRAAGLVMERHGGSLPATSREIQTLPGIGRYTAGAILSIAYNLPEPIVDANVIRVLCRVFDIHGDPASPANQALLWSLAETLVPEAVPGDFNQALMELGALVCRPGEPLCESCPLLALCAAGKTPDPSALPEYPAGRAPVFTTHASAIVRAANGDLLVALRPPRGLWGGLWEFPRVTCEPGETPEEGAVRAALEVAGLQGGAGARLATVRHSVTHHRITLHAVEVRLLPSGGAPHPLGCARLEWCAPGMLAGRPFSAPQALLCEALLERYEGISDTLQPRLELGEETDDD